MSAIDQNHIDVKSASLLRVFQDAFGMVESDSEQEYEEVRISVNDIAADIAIYPKKQQENLGRQQEVESTTLGFLAINAATGNSVKGTAAAPGATTAQSTTAYPPRFQALLAAQVGRRQATDPQRSSNKLKCYPSDNHGNIWLTMSERRYWRQQERREGSDLLRPATTGKSRNNRP